MWLLRRREWGRDGLGVGISTENGYTGSTAEHRELYSMFCDKP